MYGFEIVDKHGHVISDRSGFKTVEDRDEEAIRHLHYWAITEQACVKVMCYCDDPVLAKMIGYSNEDDRMTRYLLKQSPY